MEVFCFCRACWLSEMFKGSFKALLGAIDGKKQFQFRWKNNQLRFLSTLVLRASHCLRSLCLNDGVSFSTLNVYILIMSSAPALAQFRFGFYNMSNMFAVVIITFFLLGFYC